MPPTRLGEVAYGLLGAVQGGRWVEGASDEARGFPEAVGGHCCWRRAGGRSGLLSPWAQSRQETEPVMAEPGPSFDTPGLAPILQAMRWSLTATIGRSRKAPGLARSQAAQDGDMSRGHATARDVEWPCDRPGGRSASARGTADVRSSGRDAACAEVGGDCHPRSKR